jgi:heme exporter protein D
VVCSTDVDDCPSATACNHGTCEDLVADYQCHCDAGWQGDHCAVDIKECNSNPCQNGGTCSEPQPGVWECACLIQYKGTNCGEDADQDATSFDAQSSQDAISSTPAPVMYGAAGAGLLALIALTVLIVLRRRKKKKEEEQKKADEENTAESELNNGLSRPGSRAVLTPHH